MKALMADIDQNAFELKMRLSGFICRVLEAGTVIDLGGQNTPGADGIGGMQIVRDPDDSLLYLVHPDKPDAALPWDDLDLTAQYEIVQSLYMTMAAARRYASLSSSTEPQH